MFGSCPWLCWATIFLCVSLASFPSLDRLRLLPEENCSETKLSSSICHLPRMVGSDFLVHARPTACRCVPCSTGMSKWDFGRHRRTAPRPSADTQRKSTFGARRGVDNQLRLASSTAIGAAVVLPKVIALLLARRRALRWSFQGSSQAFEGRKHWWQPSRRCESQLLREGYRVSWS